MFDLNQAIREWRNSLRRNETMEEADFVEMESYLRDEINRQKAAGLDEETAFRAAVAQSAPVDTLGREYGKYLFHKKHYPFWHPARFMPALAWNYVKVAVRKMKAKKGYAFINIAGLSVGLAACILIFLWVREERSYDRFHAKQDRIYRVIAEDYSGAKSQWSAGSPAPLGPALLAEIPEVEAFTRVQSGWPWPIYFEGKYFAEERLAGVDPAFFAIFDFPARRGDPQTALANPRSLILTEALAGKLFDAGSDAIGKTVKLQVEDWTVSGLLKNIPRNTHFDFAFVIPLAEMAKRRRGRLDDWGWNQAATYVLLRPGARRRDIEAKMAAIFRKNLPEAKTKLSLQPLKDIHLRSASINTWMLEYPNPGHILYVAVLAVTAVGILLLACVNYLGLTTARYVVRVREAGIRMIFGARRSDLIKQFLGESTLATFAAFLIAISLVETVLPSFNALVGKNLSLLRSGEGTIFAGIAILAVFTAVLAGIGPALFLSSIRSGHLAKNISRFESPGKGRLRRAVVIIPFSATIALLIMTFAVSGQLRYIRNRNVGFDPRNLVFAHYTSAAFSFEAWKSEALKNPDVVSVGRGHPPGKTEFVGPAEADWEGKDPDVQVQFARGFSDENFLSLFKLSMAEGRFFSRAFADDSNNWVLNETAVATIGLRNPVGKWFSYNGRKGIIIGVVKDFHAGSLHQAVPPRILSFSEQSAGSPCLRFRPGKTAEIIAFLKKLGDRFAPNAPFHYTLMEETMDRWYATERRAGTILGAFAFLTIFISGLGLIGLASFMAERRTKEIGIRKILGASVPGIFSLLSRQFMSWVLLANLFSWPAAYFFARNWLKGFAYRIDLGLGLFLLSAGLALSLTLVTVGYQAVRAATANPVDSLRYE